VQVPPYLAAARDAGRTLAAVRSSCSSPRSCSWWCPSAWASTPTGALGGGLNSWGVRRSQASVCFTSLGNWFSLGAALNLLRACCSDVCWIITGLDLDGREGMTTSLLHGSTCRLVMVWSS
jgi:hypothetical protein